MKLVIIYGSPAVGKLTVAQELGRMTGFKVFHNHLSINCVRPVFDFGSPSYGTVLEAIRDLILVEAAREDVDIIFTYVHGHPDDQAYLERYCASVERFGGTVHLVHLMCDKAVIEQRATSPERADLGKLRSVEALRRLTEQYDFFTPLPGRESLQIDNTTLSPHEAAALIADHYGLSV